MSYSALGQVWRLETAPSGKPIDVSEKLVLLLLAYEMNAQGHAWPSVAKISQMTGVSVGGVQRLLVRLKRKGLLDSEPRQRTDGGTASNDYQFPWMKKGEA